jgi:hypothetical protein
MILSAFKGFNDGYVGVFVGLDVYTKHLTLIPVKDRTAKTFEQMFTKLFDELPFKVYSIMLDQEGGWMGKIVQELFKRLDVNCYNTTSENKTAGPESIIRRLRRVLARYFLKNNTRRWLEALAAFQTQYNTTATPGTGFKPNDILTDPRLDYLVYQKNTKAVREAEKALPGAKNETGMEVGDYVRLTVNKESHQKESDIAEGTHTFAVFRITKVDLSKKVVRFKLEGLDGGAIEGKAYPWEIQKISYDPDAAFAIEKIVKRRGTGKAAEVYVKWIGYTSAYNQWLPAAALERIK